MKLRTLFLAAALAGLAAGAVTAAEPQEVREGLMKKIGGSMGALSAIAKGQKPYDAEVVKTSLTAISTSIKAFPDQFPAGSEANSEASPKIWENKADFDAKAASLGADADMLLAQLPADPAGVGAALGKLGPHCGDCHQVYRVKK
ncbi:cytochrome c556 [Rhizobium sp. PP-F2F-G38]|uniref:Cytochrome c n=1 Tax=Ferranicluibacter rubi TaxID=2715133 RepID=A0AA43ZIR8_9HYPH|nr:cytochrome c [Ferranicluibacter rubi]NHT78639.1 cytochrome c [Ferranicluibacter rubi]PYE36041.1 cytochrome c556 [Rhizobium sp. PP-WC-1G-195]PYE99536.1 cytochrome c556 [Rhizobium sp. PP-F2F-G38]